MLNSYTHICLGLAIIAFLFPIAVYLNGMLFGIELQPTISHYYFAPGISNPPPNFVNPAKYRDPLDHPVRILFVGVLFTIGIFLLLYKGFTRRENAILNLAGVLALGVAILPMGRINFFIGIRPYGIDATPHLCCGFTMFACMTYISLHARHDTIRLFENPKLRDRYEFRYRWLGWLMMLSPVLALILNGIVGNQHTYVFFAESFGIWMFAFFWWVKSNELKDLTREPRTATLLRKHFLSPYSLSS
ncbi:MAG: hypothetical protein ACRECL_08740 [Bradyrhizobium sp.]